MIECKALRFQYAPSEDWVLRDVHAKFEQGGVYHLQGSNGSGKTTLLQLLSQFSPHYTGGQVEGQLLSRIPAQKTLFLQAQETMDFVYDRVDQELFFGFRVAGCGHEQANEKVSMVLAQFDIESWRHRDLASLSKGEKQFFRLVMMLTTKTYDLLCLDEPFAHMDKTFKKMILVYLQKAMHLHSMTIVFADQHPSDWSEYFDVCTFDMPDDVHSETSLWLQNLPEVSNVHGVNIVIHNVAFAYPDQNILFEPIDFNIPSASIVEILGPNGSGKSTLLSMLLGEKKATQGTIAFDAEAIRAGMLDDPLSGFVYPTMHQELKAAYVFDKQTRDRKLHRSVVESHTAQQKIWMFELVGLVACNVVLLDEPFTYLDDHNVQVMQAYMRTLAKQGKTVLYTTVTSMEGLYDQQIFLA